MSFISPIFEKINLFYPDSNQKLKGLNGVIKANIQVKGLLVSQGNKIWDDAHSEKMSSHAVCVEKILMGGATITGNCHLSDLAFDLSGKNSYGMPRNPRVPNGVTGGSSSGSASAVAEGLADFSVGTDTGGSIRIPAAYCGVWSFRPTYGLISLVGVLPTGPDYDVIGIIAKNAKVLKTVSEVLLNATPYPPPKVFYAVKELFDLCHPTYKALFEEKIKQLSNDFSIQWITLPELLQNPDFNLTEMQEASLLLLENTWETVKKSQPIGALTPEVKVNLKMAEDVSHTFSDKPGYKDTLKKRVIFYKQNLIEKLTRDDAVILLPTLPHTAPKIDQPLAAAEIHKMITLTCFSSLMGLPQVQMPLVETLEKHPLGLSLMGIPQSDTTLLSCAVDMEKHQTA